jgi:hypothetical protein
MSGLSLRIIYWSSCFALLIIGLRSPAQVPGAGSAGGVNAALTRLFGKVNAFSAQVEVRVTDKSQKELMDTPMDFSLLNKQIRVAVDMSQMRNKDMPAGAAAALKQIGMARVISVIRPDKKLIYIMYPDQQCFVAMPLKGDNPDSEDKEPRLQKTALGKETIDGHPCVKNKVVITDSKGQSVDAITWNATDLKDFPIQIQTTEKDNTSTLRFKQIQFEKPDPALFDPPSGYAEYKDQTALMTAIMKKGAAEPAAK